MTDPKISAAQALTDQLEPTVADYVASIYTGHAERAAYSQAISLKRIADALEILARPAPSATGMSHDTVALQILPGTWVNRAETADDWHEWPGGDIPPSSPGTQVDIVQRDDRRGTGAAGSFRWDHGRWPSDIVAWKLAK